VHLRQDQAWPRFSWIDLKSGRNSAPQQSWTSSYFALPDRPRQCACSAEVDARLI